MSTAEEAKKFFEICDVNSDGRITRDELRVQLEKKGKRPHEIQRIFQYCDRNRDGQIELAELTKALFGNQWDLMFDELDKDGSGTIDAKELSAMLAGRPEDLEAMDRFIKSHDKDGDGRLNRQEFIQWFMKHE